MRQAGIVAAAGIVALENMVDRLDEDHTHAKQLASGLSSIPGITLDPDSPYTNMIFMSLTDEVPLDAQQVKFELLLACGVQVAKFKILQALLCQHNIVAAGMLTKKLTVCSDGISVFNLFEFKLINFLNSP